jgi:ubiquinone/menaquinone biosynthesis C-methylase UbiE
MAAPVHFEERPEGFETMSPGLESAENYYRWIVSQLKPYLGKHLLDIGGGYGSHLAHILPLCPNTLSIELSVHAAQQLRERFELYPQFEVTQGDFGATPTLLNTLVEREFDTITAMDVLEHIEDDLAALKDMQRILARQNGILFLKVPAHQWIYGAFDRMAGHYRRYDKKRLRPLLETAGFDILHLHYFNIFGVLPWYINGRILKPNTMGGGGVGWQIKIFNSLLVPILQPVESMIKPPIGQALIAIARAKA